MQFLFDVAMRDFNNSKTGQAFVIVNFRSALLLVFLVAYDLLVIFSGLGNYYHGGSYLDSLMIDVAAVLLLWAGMKLFVEMNLFIKSAMTILMILPMIMLSGVFYRVFPWFE
ncbi:hypothetical protein [Paracidovorax avenae]|uniref:hypothetical protein n=1 Tax=Paracidovorax avenae TaxID=80867 RepID=UPI001AD824B1|nr:hypothetical protein [Paracidovorax avenae]